MERDEIVSNFTGFITLARDRVTTPLDRDCLARGSSELSDISRDLKQDELMGATTNLAVV